MGRNNLVDAASSLSRREFLGGAGLAALGIGAGGYVLSKGNRAGGEQTYILRQGYLRWEVDPISYADMTVKEFYGYSTSSASAKLPIDLYDTHAASRMFIYSGPVNDSLVFLHGSPHVDHGGTAFFKFSGLSRSNGEWAVRDDTMGSDDDFAKWEGGNSKVKWQWKAGKTDGGAYWGVLDRSDYTIKITPKTIRGVDSWRFITGTTANPDRYDLSMERPVTLRPADGREVKTANVEIMPKQDPNSFDPYANDRIVVAVRGGGEVDPADVDPGNYSVQFGSRSSLAGGNAAQPQNYYRKKGDLYLEFKTKAANFTLDSAYGYLTGKIDSKTYFRGRDVVRPGGFDNVAADDPTLVVSNLNVDPEGDDSKNLNREWVEFENAGDAKLDLSNWTVTDDDGWKFFLPDGFTLAPGDTFKLHTGDGNWTSNHLYWDAPSPIWGNDGDRVVVIDGNGNRVVDYTYPRT